MSVQWANTELPERFGGAGDAADTIEQQRARYASTRVDSRELQPGLSQHVLRADPDILVAASLDYTLRTFDPRQNFRMLQLFEGHTAAVNCVQPYRGSMLVSAGDDMTVRQWKIGKAGTKGELLLTLWVSPFPVKTICPLPCHRIACGGLDKFVRIISMVTGAVLHKITQHQACGAADGYMQSEGCGAIHCLLHLRENLLCSGSDDATVRFWDADTSSCLGSFVGHHGYGDDIGEDHREFRLAREFAPVWKLCHLGRDGTRIASASYDRTVCVWDVSDVTCAHVVQRFLAGDNAITGIVAATECRLVTCGADKEIKLWNWEAGELLQKAKVAQGAPAAAVLLRDGVVAVGGGDASLRVYDWKGDAALLGREGVPHAMDYSITDMCSIFLDEADEDQWIRHPILYATVLKSVGELDAQEAVDAAKKLLRYALTYAE